MEPCSDVARAARQNEGCEIRFGSQLAKAITAGGAAAAAAGQNTTTANLSDYSTHRRYSFVYRRVAFGQSWASSSIDNY